MNKPFQWDDLNFWQSGEWQVIQERLDELDEDKIVYTPKREDMFNALDATPFEKVKVVILGQDPYPDPKLATGLAFSIPKNVKKYPPTLENILHEYDTDLNGYAGNDDWSIKKDGPKSYPKPSSGNLEPWAAKGVLLWNSASTFTKGNEPSGRDRGSSGSWWEWDELTKEIISKLSEDKVGLVFIAWGGIAQGYVTHVDDRKHRILHSPHPSPLSARRGSGFFGSRPFTTCNAKLVEMGQAPIDWKLP